MQGTVRTEQQSLSMIDGALRRMQKQGIESGGYRIVEVVRVALQGIMQTLRQSLQIGRFDLDTVER